MSRPLVLVAEPDEETRLLLRTLLGHHGFDVAECADGVAAVNDAVRLLPSVVLMTGVLPLCDGWAATERMKRQGSLARDIPIVFIAESARRDDEARARQAGCDHYLRKPLDFEQLIRVIAEVAESPRQASARSG